MHVRALYEEHKGKEHHKGFCSIVGKKVYQDDVEVANEGLALYKKSLGNLEGQDYDDIDRIFIFTKLNLNAKTHVQINPTELHYIYYNNDHLLI